MTTLFNPDLAYLALLGGIMMGMMAFITPGTGLMEALSVFLLGAAGYGLLQFGVRSWALLIILLGGAALLAAYRRPRPAQTIGSIFALAIGAGLLYPQAHLLLVVSGGLIFSAMMWFMHHQMQSVPPLPANTSLEEAIGQIGEAKTEIHHEGSVQVGGQLWSARSETPIPAGSTVRVLNAEGFILTVEMVAGPPAPEEPPL